MERDTLSLYEQSSPSRPVSILEIPFEYGSDARGLREAPKYLLDSGLLKMLDSLGAPLSAHVKVPVPAPQEPTLEFPKYLEETAEVARSAYALVREARARGERVIALCGDHASAIGTIQGAAMARKRLGVIYIDAHPDIHTDTTTISGNTHAMVASAAMGLGSSALCEIGGKRGKVAPEDFLFIAVKDFDPQEISLLRESGSPVFTMFDITARGLAPVFAAIDELSKRADEVWVSMDLDSIDKAFAPGVAMPCEDGLTRREALSLAHYIGKRCPVAGMDIVEILPGKDIGRKTARLALELVARFLGGEYSSYRNYMSGYEAARPKKSRPRAKRRSAAIS